MHHALEIEEVLLNILCHCSQDDLPALARTCLTFKEPALDTIWEELYNMAPIVRCLPEVCNGPSPEKKLYRFGRKLTQMEWDTLRSYTRRVRSIQNTFQLDRKSIRALLIAPGTTEPLFPNLRHIRLIYTPKNMHVLYLPLPSLTSLDVEFVSENQSLLQNSVEVFHRHYSTLQKLSVLVNFHEIMDANTLLHLSRFTALTCLDFRPSNALTDQLTTSDLTLSFPYLRELRLRSRTLDSISCLLSHTRLPTIHIFDARAELCPSKWDVRSFMSNIRISGLYQTIQAFHLSQSRHDAAVDPGQVLGWTELQPYMAFTNLRSIIIDLCWKVVLTGPELLALVSAWPHLEELYINSCYGWKGHGITLDELVEIMRKRPSLGEIAVAIDTRDYTNFPPSPGSLGLTWPFINVVDSIIEEEAVLAVSTFFAEALAPMPGWPGMRYLVEWNSNSKRWREVVEFAVQAWLVHHGERRL